MYILGLWDGHDSGAALIDGSKIIFAANEERFTKRKLEVKFPYNSIKAALDYAGIGPGDVETVSFPTTEFTKTLSRIFPFQKEAYYKFRRRKMLKPRAERLAHNTKYTLTRIGVLPFTKTLSKLAISRELRRMGFGKFRLYSVDHHAAHAATAAFTSGFRKSIVITMDGLGDGLSSTVNIYSGGHLKRVSTVSATNSIGIFYEQVTNIVGMRELEDEGKVMAMADYSFPFSFEENKLKDFYRVEGLSITAKYSPVKQYDMLSRLAWSIPREQFSYMAQQLLENIATTFVENAMEALGISEVALAGGVFSNVKANMKIRDLNKLKNIFVFPHMGDGGIALGAAMYTNYKINGASEYKFEDAYLGNRYSDEYITDALKNEKGLGFEEVKEKWGHAADLIDDDEYIFWFQGRMEYGPRALGDRSILAKAGSDEVKDRLNLYVKQREWYQPFAPSMLRSDAKSLLENVKCYDKFMTTAYRIRPDRKNLMKSVIHVDLTARPQMVGDENPSYKRLLEKIKRKAGYGIVLNTSFNIHGQPIVMSPEDAIYTMKKTKTKHMFLENYYVENKNV